jgi:hypothetical protein
LPEGIPRLEAHLVVLKAPMQALQKVIEQAERATDDPDHKGSIVSVRRDFGLTGALFAGTRAVLDGLFTTVLVLYFLLVSGDLFLRRIVEILPKLSDKRQAVDISQQIAEDISAYLLTITAMIAVWESRPRPRCRDARSLQTCCAIRTTRYWHGGQDKQVNPVNVTMPTLPGLRPAFPKERIPGR